jgi:hypothetical protein
MMKNPDRSCSRVRKRLAVGNYRAFHAPARFPESRIGRLDLDEPALLGKGEMTILKDMESFDQEHDQYMQDLKSGSRSD